MAVGSCALESMAGRVLPPNSASSGLNEVVVIYCDMDDDEAVGAVAVDKTIGDGDDVA